MPTNPITADNLGAEGIGRPFGSTNADNHWFPALQNALGALGELPGGWDSYHADAPDATAVANATAVVKRCSEIGFRPAKVLPSVEGGIAIVFGTDAKYADIECFNTGEILAVISDSKSEPDVWTVEQTALALTLEKIRGYLGQ